MKTKFILPLLCLLASSMQMSAQKVHVLSTTANRELSLDRSKVKLSSEASYPLQIHIDTHTKHQTMDGFGAAMTGSTCYNLMQMSQQDRRDFLMQTFSHKKGLGYSYIRISIGCSDFSLSEYTCCDKPGIQNFALQHEELTYVIPVLKEILSINPEIKILGSPWTCPKWMKVNNLKELKPFDSWTSGQLHPKFYHDYATYFVKWIKAFEQQGIAIYAVTPQNEPLNRGNSASLYMGWQEELNFVKDALGPALRKAELNTRIYAFDHNYNYDNILNEKDYPIKIYDNEEAAAFITGAAYHNYGGNKSELTKVAYSRPGKELIFTETSIGMWNDGRNLSKRLMEDMREVALGTVNNGCKAVIVWNLMLDSERGPNRDGGCQTCYGAVDIDRNNYKDITFNSHYYIIGHLAQVVKPGAVRVETKTPHLPKGLTCSAFVNVDGSTAMVCLNEALHPVRFSVSADNQHYINYTMPAQSVVSFRW